MKKKLVSMLLVLLMAAMVIAPAALAAASATVKLPGNYTALNVRSGPGTDYDVVGWVQEGSKVSILEKGDVWSKVELAKSGKVGYLKNMYLNTSGGSSSTPSGSGYDVGRVRANNAGSYVNMRKGAGTSYAVCGSLKNGTAVKLLGSSGNWYKIQTMGGQTGYMSKNYIASGATMTTTAGVNMRKSPNGAVIKTLAKGSSVTVTRVEGSWSVVKSGKSTGYVFSKYLR